MTQALPLEPASQCKIKDGSMIAYQEAGSGEPLVLLHGIGSNAGSWQHQLDGLATRRRVIAWDAPGYGDSTRFVQEKPVPADYAHQLAAFLDALKIETCDLLGHSLGALMATSFSAQSPDRVKRLILASCAAGYGTPTDGPYPATIENRLNDIDRLGPDGLAAKRSRGLLTEDASPEMVSAVQNAMAEITREGYRQATFMLAQGDIFNDATGISAPTLVLCGEQDKITPLEGNQKVSDAIPGARFQTIPGAGHAVYLEKATAFNEAVDAFLEGS
ncbi:MAG: alpha/beta hydrolase [Proteobacteria bacterium]|nr:alpha/beta hydrolase [Pseudomonadota bacterium]